MHGEPKDPPIANYTTGMSGLLFYVYLSNVVLKGSMQDVNNSIHHPLSGSYTSGWPFHAWLSMLKVNLANPTCCQMEKVMMMMRHLFYLDNVLYCILVF